MTKRAYRTLVAGCDSDKKEVEILHVCRGCDMATVRHLDGRVESVTPAYLIPIPEEFGVRKGKVMKFAHRLPPSILSGERDITWRHDAQEKHWEPGDIAALATNDGEVFARAEILWTKETVFGRLTDEDKKGHEKFESDEAIYQTYSGYYHKKIGPDSSVTVIKFRLL